MSWIVLLELESFPTSTILSKLIRKFSTTTNNHFPILAVLSNFGTNFPISFRSFELSSSSFFPTALTVRSRKVFVDYFILFESDRWKVPEYSRSVFLLKFNFSTCSRFIPVPLENLTDRLSFVSLYFRKIQETTFLINMTNHPWDNKFNNFFFWPRMTTWFVDDHGNFEIFDNLENLFVLEYPTTSY